MKNQLRRLIQTQCYYYRSSIKALIYLVHAYIRGVKRIGSRLRYTIYHLQYCLYLLPLTIQIYSSIIFSITYLTFKNTLQLTTQPSSRSCRIIFRITYILLLTTWIFDFRPSLSTQYSCIYSIRITRFTTSSSIKVLATSTISSRLHLLL